jgi:hypothetical protein
VECRLEVGAEHARLELLSVFSFPGLQAQVLPLWPAHGKTCCTGVQVCVHAWKAQAGASWLTAEVGGSQ